VTAAHHDVLTHPSHTFIEATAMFGLPTSSQFLKLTATILVVGACAHSLPAAGDLVAPKPIPSGTGKFVSPYTSDGTIAEWVVKGRAAKLGGAVGSMAGQKAGEKVASQVPIFGSWLGGKVGNKAGREIALKWVGGEAAMRATSDISFDSIDDLIVYLYTEGYPAKSKDWAEVYDLTTAIYPELADRWSDAISNARRRGL
jgi:hypothetical protein